MSGLLDADLNAAGIHMLFLLAVVIVSIAVIVIPRLRMPGAVKSANLGRMSEQWMAEHSASHSQ